MTKDQKKLFKSLKKDKFKDAFIMMLRAQQNVMGGYRHWEGAYSRKCNKDNERPPSET